MTTRHNKKVDDVKQYNSHHPKLKEGIMNGMIPSAVIDSGASSNVGITKDGFGATGRKSNKVFPLLDRSSSITKDTVEQQLKIYKIQAKAANNDINQQCQLQHNAHTQWVQRVIAATSPQMIKFNEVPNKPPKH